MGLIYTWNCGQTVSVVATRIWLIASDFFPGLTYMDINDKTQTVTVG